MADFTRKLRAPGPSLFFFCTDQQKSPCSAARESIRGGGSAAGGSASRGRGFHGMEGGGEVGVEAAQEIEVVLGEGERLDGMHDDVADGVEALEAGAGPRRDAGQARARSASSPR
jgi:hypothetical protein